MAVKIETGSVKNVAEKTKAEAIVKLAFGGIKTGEAKLAPSVPANASYKYAINVGAMNASFAEIKRCYEESIKIAEEQGIKTVVFPLLGADDEQAPLAKIVGIALKALYEANEDLNLILAVSETIQNTLKENVSDIPHDAISDFVQKQGHYDVGSNGHSGNTSSTHALDLITMKRREDLPADFPMDLYDEIEDEQDELDDDEECREKIKEFFAPYIENDKKRKQSKSFNPSVDFGSIEARFMGFMPSEDNEGSYIAKSAFIDLVQGKGKTKPSKYNLTLAAWAYELDLNELNDLLYVAGYELNTSLKDKFIKHAFANGNSIEDVDAWLTAWDKGDSTFAAAAAKNRKRAKKKEIKE